MIAQSFGNVAVSPQLGLTTSFSEKLCRSTTEQLRSGSVGYFAENIGELTKLDCMRTVVDSFKKRIGWAICN